MLRNFCIIRVQNEPLSAPDSVLGGEYYSSFYVRDDNVVSGPVQADGCPTCTHVDAVFCVLTNLSRVSFDKFERCLHLFRRAETCWQKNDKFTIPEASKLISAPLPKLESALRGAKGGGLERALLEVVVSKTVTSKDEARR